MKQANGVYNDDDDDDDSDTDDKKTGGNSKNRKSVGRRTDPRRANQRDQRNYPSNYNKDATTSTNCKATEDEKRAKTSGSGDGPTEKSGVQSNDSAAMNLGDSAVSTTENEKETKDGATLDRNSDRTDDNTKEGKNLQEKKDGGSRKRKRDEKDPTASPKKRIQEDDKGQSQAMETNVDDAKDVASGAAATMQIDTKAGTTAPDKVNEGDNNDEEADDKDNTAGDANASTSGSISISSSMNLENTNERRARRARRQPTLYDPQDGPASVWQSDGSAEWRYLTSDEKDTPDKQRTTRKKQYRSSQAGGDGTTTPTKTSGSDNDNDERGQEDEPVWCNFCKDDPAIPVCCFCACRVCFGKHDGVSTHEEIYIF